MDSAVGHHNGGAAFHQSRQGLLHGGLALGIEGALVASSSTRMGQSASMARAMAMRWRWPPDSF